MLSCPPVSGGQRPEEARVTQPGRGERGARGVQDLYMGEYSYVLEDAVSLKFILTRNILLEK